ncbi:dienelactone hydrolase [Sphingosinithalassobacter tenebrarum]|uniref:Dienelactone hydrolase n=1 Tax=Stakelama tenebrarum TaxID=2711215 RepID=A0A6G6YB87_9SPHN|nr:dienelactone hydrolase [Sphingosinithalassobacter tenebrarum]
MGIWYPAEGKPVARRVGLYSQQVVPDAPLPSGSHPLVVISHGTGGDFAGHVDTAVALARAGFVVASLTHPGDNWRDNSRAAVIQDRPAALSALITHMLTRWEGRGSIDPERIGAFGFSSGGFTVLAAAGGRADFARLPGHCRQHPDFFDCSVISGRSESAMPEWRVVPDPRIKALVVAAPALGFAFGPEGLAEVTMPVQLWRAEEDRVLPAPHYAEAVRAALPQPPEYHVVPGAAHLDFLAPCVEPVTVPMPCQKEGFDRAAFHEDFDREVVRFFREALGD